MSVMKKASNTTNSPSGSGISSAPGTRPTPSPKYPSRCIFSTWTEEILEVPNSTVWLVCNSNTAKSLNVSSDDETVGSFFNYTHRAIQETLARSGVVARDLAWVAPQNTNRKAWQILSRLLGIPVERVAMRTIGEAAHMISGDNVFNLKALEEEGALRAGDLVLLPMAGYGMNWQCTLLRRRAGR